MRLVVDLTRCQAYAQCVCLAPRMFELQAAAACPVEAIFVGEAVSAGAR